MRAAYARYDVEYVILLVLLMQQQCIGGERTYVCIAYAQNYNVRVALFPCSFVSSTDVAACKCCLLHI